MLSGLLIRSPWIDRILDGSKTWEIRGNRTGKQGRIALIKSGSGTVVGVADLVGVTGPLRLAELVVNAQKAGFLQSEAPKRLPYKRTFAWILNNPKRLEQPVAYVHPSGSVIWVSLSPTVSNRILRQLSSTQRGR